MNTQNITAENVKILNILLTECSFKRAANITIDPSKIATAVNFNVSTQLESENKSIIIVTEHLNFRQAPKENTELEDASASITYIGVAKIIGDYSDEEKIRFGNINIGAMLYPYIREQLSSFTIKSGLNYIILPPYNFTSQLKVKEKIEEEKSE